MNKKINKYAQSPTWVSSLKKLSWFIHLTTMFNKKKKILNKKAKERKLFRTDLKRMVCRIWNEGVEDAGSVKGLGDDVGEEEFE